MLAGDLLLASKQPRSLDYVVHAWLLLTDFDGMIAVHNCCAKDQSCWAKIFGLLGGEACRTLAAVEFGGSPLPTLAPELAASIVMVVPVSVF